MAVEPSNTMFKTKFYSARGFRVRSLASFFLHHLGDLALAVITDMVAHLLLHASGLQL